MAKTKTIYVDPDASGSNDGTSWTDAYTGLNTAISSSAADITPLGSDEIHQYLCRSSSGTADSIGSTTMTFAGYSTTLTNYISISGVDSFDGVWDTSSYRMVRASGTNADIFRANGTWDAVLKFQNLQIQCLRNANFITAFDFNHGTNTPNIFDVEIDRCIVRGPGASAVSLSWGIDIRSIGDAPACNMVIKNSLWYDWGRNVYEQGGTGQDSFEFFNNTCLRTTNESIANYTNTSSMKWYNNIILSGDTGTGLRFNYGDHDYNASNDTTNASTNDVDLSSISSLTEIFDTPTGDGDFNLVANAPVIDEGTDLSSSGVTGDIAGTARGATWDIGCFEYVAASTPEEGKYSDQARVLYIS